MSGDDWAWKIAIRVGPATPTTVSWLRRALAPGLEREVPRTFASISAPAEDLLCLDVRTRDTGAARAALNTYLGSIHLAAETMQRAESARARNP